MTGQPKLPEKYKVQHLCDIMNATNVSGKWSDATVRNKYGKADYRIRHIKKEGAPIPVQLVENVGFVCIYSYSKGVGLGISCLETAVCIDKSATALEMQPTESELFMLYVEDGMEGNGINIYRPGTSANQRQTYQEYLASDHWQVVREEAIKRAGGRCMLCNTDIGPLHVHHRTYDRLGDEAPEDVIVLCAIHHRQFHGKDGGK